jgi:uncharacterized protein
MSKLHKLSQRLQHAFEQWSGAALPSLSYHPKGIFARLVPQIKILKKHYIPTFWLSNPHAQIVYFDLFKRHLIQFQYDEIQQMEMQDGGVTAIAWYGKKLSPTTPTIVLMHTLTGSPETMQELVQDLHRYTGWRVALCLRRGHAKLPMPVPKINILGSTEDLREQLEAIKIQYPESDLYAVGSSAGTGLLVRYLGEAGLDTPIKAAFALSPGYNSESGFALVHPIYSKLMTKKLFKVFIQPYQATWQWTNLEQVLQTKTLAEFEKQYFNMAGFNDYHSYAQAVNPIYVMQDIQIPLVVLNAEDDPICHIQNLDPYRQKLAEMPNILVVTTPKGGHCLFYQGFGKTQSWATRLIAEYFRQYQVMTHTKKPRQAGLLASSAA